MTAKKDFTQVAFDVVRQATGETPKPAPSPEQEAKRTGGRKGGRTRMGALTAEERSALAHKAAKTRWGK